MHPALNKVFSLIKKTGDRCIVLAPDSDDAYVVMSLAEYERVVLGRADVSELSEDELLDKINRDIAVWKSQQEERKQDDLLLDIGQGDARSDMSPNSDYFADTSQNFDDFTDFKEDFDEQEEPFYFEKV